MVYALTLYFLVKYLTSAHVLTIFYQKGEKLIKCLVTDFGRVIGTFDSRVNVLKKIALTFSEAQEGGDWGDDHVFIRELFGCNGDISPEEEMFYHRLDTGSSTVEELWLSFLEKSRSRRSLKKATKNCDFETFKGLWCGHLKLIGPTVDVYREVQKRYPLVGVSNGDRESLDYFTSLLENEGQLHFHRLFLSARERCKKNELFDRVAEILIKEDNIQPRECLYLDDRETYVRGARRRCFRAYHFDATAFPSFEDAADEMRSLLKRNGMEF